MTGTDEKEGEIAERLRVVQVLTEQFKLERMVYVCFGVAAFVMLLVCLAVMLVRGEATEAIVGAFGSSGVVAFTSGRMLVMWNDAVRTVLAPLNRAGEDK